MSGRILVVDDIDANVRLLEAKLKLDYFDVITASRGEEAVAKARADKPDIVLLDVMMPGMDGFEACRRIKGDPETRHIPVVMVTTLDSREDRVRGLLAGADDFLSKPIDDLQLMARVKSLLRLKIVSDELRAREASGVRLGVIGEHHHDPVEPHRMIAGRVLVIDDQPRQARRIKSALGLEHSVFVMGENAQENDAPPDLAIVSLTATTFDGCKVIAKMRSSESTRHLPILAVIDRTQQERVVRALDLGAHDIISRPIDEDELAARARTLIKRKRYVDALRQRLDQSMELAVTDQLTGLYNRRFLHTQLAPLVQRAACGGDPVSLVIVDIDHFKRINDTYGHDCGDDVLREFAARLATNTRPADFACRMGGEEFVVIMPGSPGDSACLAAERMRRHMVSSPVRVGDVSLDVTASFGVAQSEGFEETAESLIKRADEALYEAKAQGRNRVIGRAASQAA